MSDTNCRFCGTPIDPSVLPDPQCDCDVAIIERLRADLAVAQSLARVQAGKTVAANRRIEELDEECYNVGQKNGELNKRIKELEKQNDDRLKLWNKQHHITDAQIDAARSYINRGSPHEEILLEVFAELDISWCEGCGSREVKDE